MYLMRYHDIGPLIGRHPTVGRSSLIQGGGVKADGIERDVRYLAAHGRAVGSHGHERARAYVVDRFAALGVTPYRGQFVHEYAPDFANVLGVLAGDSETIRAPIVIGAHYDTYGDAPGADDNATGVAILLYLAEALRSVPHQRDMVLAAFDAEESPHGFTPLMGSNAFFEQQGGEAAACAIVFDIVGHDFPIPVRKRAIVVTGAESHPDLATALEQIGQPKGLHVLVAHSKYVTSGDAADLSDYHVFRAHQRPFLFLSAGHWPRYHMPTDTPDRLDFGKVRAVAEYVLRILSELDDRPLDPDRPAEDTLALELQTIRAVLGPLGLVSLVMLRGRSDLDRFAEWLRGRFGI